MVDYFSDELSPSLFILECHWLLFIHEHSELAFFALEARVELHQRLNIQHVPSSLHGFCHFLFAFLNECLSDFIVSPSKLAFCKNSYSSVCTTSEDVSVEVAFDSPNGVGVQDGLLFSLQSSYFESSVIPSTQNQCFSVLFNLANCENKS